MSHGIQVWVSAQSARLMAAYPSNFIEVVFQTATWHGAGWTIKVFYRATRQTSFDFKPISDADLHKAMHLDQEFIDGLLKKEAA